MQFLINFLCNLAGYAAVFVVGYGLCEWKYIKLLFKKKDSDLPPSESDQEKRDRCPRCGYKWD